MKGKKIRLFDVINTILLLLLAFVCIYPLYYTVIASFSDYIPVATGKVSFWPIDFTTLAYEAILDNKEIWLGYRNTIIYTILGTLFNLFLTVPTAYVMSKKRMFGHTLLTWFFLITMYFSGGMVPTYLLYRNLNLINNPMIMIVTGGLSVYNMIVARTYFSSSIPESLYESVKIDGGSEFDQFFRIALPLSKPVVAVITLYYAVGHWNSYFNAMMYLSNRKYHPLALVLRRILILNESIVSDDRLANMDARILADLTQKANMAVVMKYALVLISSLPLLIAYPFVQKYFVKGVMIGSVKG
ncbi:carbohydrate ABC transporter permease [Acetatifactor muris]|uniref:Lactose transport system permease protein LacG n=1 Tax=Acetatifactor muris TaxID=879566 RepID=A0A2K4ZI87_9FIRM|nr:carbohydrate ABC transporter permease [Acetatifactor muris]MCI8798570.1 carbohydrate ABC transporter permease [Lachnospiraceae bacterium]MCR2048393.1 carbohydrate ABC transporter permease [Acetatifactor muris]SOY30197.1 Lactose transport system permease protein LacG [Acetatifactor muris]